MKHRIALAALLALTLVGSPPPSLGRDDSQEQPTTLHPSIGPIQKTFSTSGTFVADNAAEIRIHLKSSIPLRVVEAVKHGASVKKGDMLVRFDPEEFEEKIADQEHSVAMMKLELEESEFEHQLAEQQLPLDREQAELTKRKADEDFAFYMEFELPLSVKSNDESLKSNEDMVAYTAEELRQLEKMYKADDLTEESEEIVLKRARDDLDRSKFSLEQTKLHHRRAKDFDIPRTKREEERTHRQAEIALEQFRFSQPLNRNRQVLALKKLKMELKRATKELDDLKSDLAGLTVTAPQNGVVYYGKATDGKWNEVTEMKTKLRPEGTVASNEILMTLVSPLELSIVGNVPEADSVHIAVGSKGHVRATAFPNHTIAATVRSIDKIPSDDGHFMMALDLEEPTKSVVAGMTCTIKLITYFHPKGLTVPADCVKTDELDDTKRYVFVTDAQGASQKRSVEVGVQLGDRIEIRSGLSVEDNVVTDSKP